jgi:hypothetical protein
VIPKRALGRVIRRTAADKKRYQKTLAPRSDITRLIAPSIAPPRELTAIAALFATLLNNGADLAGPLAGRYPVQDHVSNRDFTLQRLAPRFMLNIKGETP